MTIAVCIYRPGFRHRQTDIIRCLFLFMIPACDVFAGVIAHDDDGHQQLLRVVFHYRYVVAALHFRHRVGRVAVCRPYPRIFTSVQMDMPALCVETFVEDDDLFHDEIVICSNRFTIRCRSV